MRAGASSPPADRAPDRKRVGRAPLHQVLVRAAKSFLAHHMTDRAATLTYFAMMSLFPALLVGVTLLGLVGQQGLVTDATNYLVDHGVDDETANVVRRVLQNMVNASGGTLGVTLLVSVLLALNGASGAFGAAGRALNVVYGADESRGMVGRKLTDLATALVVIVLFAVVLASIFLGGQIADDLFGKIGLGSTAATIWSYVRWPVALVAATVAYGIVYGLAPDVEPRRIRWITPGCRRRGRAVDRALGRLLDLRAQLLELWRRVRRLRRGHRAAAVALPVGQRVPLRRRAQRRARARRAATIRPARGR